MRRVSIRVRVPRLLAIVGMVAVMLGAAAGAGAQTSEIVDRSRLRVCADPGNMPFSNKAGEGFENRIAELVADALEVPIHYTWFPQATGFIRNTLQARKCDVIIGISLGFELLQNTNPYYRTAYVLVHRADAEFSADSLKDTALKDKRIGVIAGTPPGNLMARYGLMGKARPYHLMVDTRFSQPGRQMIDDIIAGDIDAGVLWGPIAGYFAKQSGADLKVVPLLKETEGPKMDYRITMGVRFNEPNWKRLLNKVIRKTQGRINAILHDYGVPLLDNQGKLMKAASLLPKPDVPELAGYRLDHYRAPVPAGLTGATTVEVLETKALVDAGETILIDVLPRPPKPAGLPEGTLWRPRPRHNIPGSLWLANTGFGALAPEVEAYFADNLDRASGGDKDRKMLFYCLADCWMSWNAAKRALALGYRQVYWFPGGTDAWEATGYDLAESDPVPMGGEGS